MAVTSVTENRVTVTASATEDDIRRDAGFAPKAGPAPPSAKDSSVTVSDAELDATPVDATPATETASSASDRNPDGTFKAKTEKAEAKPDKSGDPRKSIQAKIDAEVRRRGEAERRAEAAERRAQELEARLSAPAPVETPEPVKPAAEPPKRGSAAYLQLVKEAEADPDYPRLEDFVAAGFADPYAACNAAQAAFLQDKQLALRDQTARMEQAQAQAWDRLRASDEAGAEKYPDWHDRLQSAEARLPLPPTVIQEIFESDSSADVRYYLLTHPDEIRALQAVTDPIAAARAIARLSVTAGSSANSGPEPLAEPRGSRAKPLIKPVSASPAAPEASPPDTLPFGPKYIEAINAQERRQRGARGA